MIAVRRAADGDREAVLDVLGRSGLPLEGLSDHWRTTLVATDGDRVVGSAALEVYDDGALLRSVAVDAEYRGKNTGSLLVEAALRLAYERGVSEVFLLTETAATFFPRFGFKVASRDAVPAGVAQSVEFTAVCPVSAFVMRTDLR